MSWKCHNINCRGQNHDKVKKCWKCGEAKRDKPPKDKKR